MLKLIADWLGGVKAPPPQTRLSFRVMLDDLEVGKLERDREEWVFRYSADFRAQSSVKPIVNFPQLEKEYRSTQLWPFFLVRIPSLAQPAVQRHLAKHRVSEADEGMLLTEFGRWSAANPFELEPA